MQSQKTGSQMGYYLHSGSNKKNILHFYLNVEEINLKSFLLLLVIYLLTLFIVLTTYCYMIKRLMNNKFESIWKRIITV